MKVLIKFILVTSVLGWIGCGDAPSPAFTTIGDDPTDVPLKAAAADLVSRFRDGDAAFDVVYRDADGLGPVYVRTACSSCHNGASKGPGNVQKMAMVEADGITAAADQSALVYGHTVRPYVAGGATTPLLPPENTPRLKLSVRQGVAVFGRGYLEAIADSEIERVAAEQAARGDGISGRVNRVVFTSEANPDTRFHRHSKGDGGIIGRFGLKARIATLDDFAADAAQGDMSITSPMRPAELANPNGKTDDLKAGVDIDVQVINQLADYMRLLAIPPRAAPPERGPALFQAALCGVCHVPSLRTRDDYPFAPLAAIDAPVFTDLLVHDMGDALADGLTEGLASSREWRTAPLIGMRHQRGLLHDGRAKTMDEAILQHDGVGSEAHVAIQRYRALPDGDRAVLLQYVSSL